MALFFLSSILTLVSSNDIVILTLTPIVAVFTKATETDPTPFLFAQFFAANIWSVSLIIGNPTNIIVAEGFKIGFLDYSCNYFLMNNRKQKIKSRIILFLKFLVWMVPAAISSGFTCLLCFWIYFYRKIPIKFVLTKSQKPQLKDRTGAIFGI